MPRMFDSQSCHLKKKAFYWNIVESDYLSTSNSQTGCRVYSKVTPGLSRSTVKSLLFVQLDAIHEAYSPIFLAFVYQSAYHHYHKQFNGVNQVHTASTTSLTHTHSQPMGFWCRYL